MEGTSRGDRPVKDPRRNAWKYQLDLCSRATKENIIVYLGTGCGKTRIAVLLMHELRDVIRRPNRRVCIFLAPTLLLVRQQAMVIEDLTDFRVLCCHGNSRTLKDHDEWTNEIEQYEVLVMTPQILLHNLRHCFIRMDMVALLIFDECHHAQTHKRHAYAQIMKEFYKPEIERCPRIFGMTASPIIGKGGTQTLGYTKCINSLETLLDAKVCSVDDASELESFSPSPQLRFVTYDAVVHDASSAIVGYENALKVIKNECIQILREKLSDIDDYKKQHKYLKRWHESIMFCLKSIGLSGAIRAARILLASNGLEHEEMRTTECDVDSFLASSFLTKAISALNNKLFDGSEDDDDEANSLLETIEEPFFSKKFSALIRILSTHRLEDNIKCIIFVKRILVAKSIAYILANLQSLDSWKCEFLVGCHFGSKNMSRKRMNAIVEQFRSGEVNLLVATNVAEEGLDIQTCCLVVRFDLPETVASFIQSRGRARTMKSDYVFLVERGNHVEEELVNDFISGENIMNKEITNRTSDETFVDSRESVYKVDKTGASITTGCSISLLYQYCDRLPRDEYFNPSPKFFYFDEEYGTICRLVLPPNAPIHQVDSFPKPSKAEAKRHACLNACIKLHELGALTDFLLPRLVDGKKEKKKGSESISAGCESSQDETSREELHQMLVPAALCISWDYDNHINLHFYYIRFEAIPEDRNYRLFGLFIKSPLPKEAESFKVDLHLAHGRIVHASLVSLGVTNFNNEEIVLAEKFQEMFLKIILDRKEFYYDYVTLGLASNSSKFYLLLPLKKQKYGKKKMAIDWPTLRRCLSSPVFRHEAITHDTDSYRVNDTLELLNGPVNKAEVLGSLIFTPHNKLFFFVDGILHGSHAYRQYKGTSYAEYYQNRKPGSLFHELCGILPWQRKITSRPIEETFSLILLVDHCASLRWLGSIRYGIQLSHGGQPFLKAKQLFLYHNLLHNRSKENTEVCELAEHFFELPPEVCSLKIVGFSKDIGSSISLLPSFLHRLENLLVAVELKNVFLSSFPEAANIRVDRILEALTTEKCLECPSLERLEVLGDAFLKYVVSRQSFLSCEGLDEGQLTSRRASMVNNSKLYELAIAKNLQVYIHDEQFDPTQFFTLGRPCKIVCNEQTESNIHQQGNGSEARNVKCTKHHHWLHRKTIADVVEALVGAFLVESGFKAAISFLKWIGIDVEFKLSDVYRTCESSISNMSLVDNIDIKKLEQFLGYSFNYKGLLLQAFVHPSFNKHSGECYQKLEFLGDAVIEYLITSYIYSAYQDIKPGQITYLRSIIVNNNSFAQVAVYWGLHNYLIKDSKYLSDAISKFEKSIRLPESEILEEPSCPKVLGDIVESCFGAVLLDSGFDLKGVWDLMLMLLDPVLSLSKLQLNPLRELRELCQSCNFELGLPNPEKDGDIFNVRVEVDMQGENLSFSSSNRNSRAARRIAAQEALSELKARGHKHKSKSLEEILRLARKQEPELIGFDEAPILVNGADSTIFERSSLGAPSDLCFGIENQTSSSSSEASSLSTTQGNSKDESGRSIVQPLLQNHDGATAAIIDSCQRETTATSHRKTARSRLMEICVANSWKQPVYECCQEEGPPHLKMFTYKVTIEIEGATPKLLECFSELMTQIKAAKEHAAEGALWYLQQVGYNISA